MLIIGTMVVIRWWLEPWMQNLVLFVFFAKNPYTGSAWDFLHFIRHDWQRNVLFVLQQCDLIPSEQRKRTLDHIREQLAERGIESPTIFAVSVKTGTGLGALRDYLRNQVVEGRQFGKVQSLLQNLTRFARGLETLLKNHEKLNQHDEMLLGKLQGLTLNLQTEAEVEKQVAMILDLCRQRTEEASKRLLKRFQSQLTLLDKLDVLKNALAGGREVRQWLAEFFGHVQQDINNVIYQAQLRYFSDLHQRAKLLAKQMLEVLASRPKHLKKPGEDAMGHRREQTLNELRQRLAALDELRPEEAVQPRTTLGPLNRLLLFYRVAQGAAALALLMLGVYSSGLITGLILGGMAYVGVGYGLFARNRERLQKHCIKALADSLSDLEQRLRTNLSEQLTTLQQIGDSVRTLFERDLKDRRGQTEQLLNKTQQLLDQLARFQQQA
ncbi:hypothetical protein CCP4SC76_3100002 [Gammaproteobacteria bacterium]